MSPDKDGYNWPRTLRMGFWGFAICGPVLGLWYRTLHASAEVMMSSRISYAPVVSGRMAWLLERAPALQWVTNLHFERVQTASTTKVGRSAARTVGA